MRIGKKIVFCPYSQMWVDEYVDEETGDYIIATQTWSTIALKWMGVMRRHGVTKEDCETAASYLERVDRMLETCREFYDDEEVFELQHSGLKILGVI